MPWSGTGTYSLPPAYSPEVNGTVIDAARYNGLTLDIATGLTAALAKNGENVPTANLPMGGFKHTGAADGNAAGQYLTFGNATGSLGNLNVTAATVPANGIYLSAANSVGFATNTTARLNLNTASLSPATDGGITLGADALRFSRLSVQAISDGAAATGNLLISSGTDVRLASGSTWQSLNLYTNGSSRLAIGSTGNVVIAAPTSAVPTLRITGNAGECAALFAPDAGHQEALRFEGASPYLGFWNAGSSVRAGFLSMSTAGAAYLSVDAAQSLILRTTAADRITIGSGGNVVIAEPTSGVALTLTGSEILRMVFDAPFISFYNYANTVRTGYLQFQAASGSVMMVDINQELAFGTNATIRFGITADGRIYGTGLHNNGTVTGTTSQYIASGTYTPSESHNANITSLTVRPAQWIRVGNVVTVSGGLESVISNTGGGATSNLSLTLPIASSLANFWELGGTCSIVDIVGSTNGSVTAQTALDRASLSISITTAATYNWSYTYSYVIL
jgi:hypothetical protein